MRGIELAFIATVNAGVLLLLSGSLFLLFVAGYDSLAYLFGG